MKCKHCGAEIADDSLYCEFCGKKVKKGVLKFWVSGGMLVVGLVIGILYLVNYNRSVEIEDTIIDSWPPCHDGKDEYYVLSKNGVQSLVQVERWFPIRVKRVAYVVGKIFSCEGEHNGLGAFVLLSNDGKVTFVTDYDNRGNHTDRYFIINNAEGVLYSDEYHIYGVNDDSYCGDNGIHNVETIFSNDFQPVKKVDNKWQYINLKGKTVFEDKFEDAYPFCYGKARVLQNGKWDYIDIDGQKLRIHDANNRSYEILQGENFYYDNNLQKVVAKILLGRYAYYNDSKKRCDFGSDFWAVVDEEGLIVEKSII